MELRNAEMGRAETAGKINRNRSDLVLINDIFYCGARNRYTSVYRVCKLLIAMKSHLNVPTLNRRLRAAAAAFKKEKKWTQLNS